MKRFFTRILAAALLCFAALSCVGCKENVTGPPGAVEYPCGIGDTIYVDKGALSLDEVAIVREIDKGTETYRSRKQGFLVFRMRFDFQKYSLKTCGVTIEGDAPDYSAIRLNYRRIEGKQGLYCPVEEDGDFNLGVSAKLSADLHIGEEEGETKGAVYLCFDLSSDLYDYLYERRYAETADEADTGGSYRNIALDLNDVQKTGVTCVAIGGAFRLVSFTEQYVISDEMTERLSPAAAGGLF